MGRAARLPQVHRHDVAQRLAELLLTTSPEADGHGEFSPQRVQTVRWTSPLTNRLLLEAGVGTTYYQWGGRKELDPNPTRDLVQMLDLTPDGQPAGLVDRDDVPLAELVEQPDRRRDLVLRRARTSPDRTA